MGSHSAVVPPMASRRRMWLLLLEMIAETLRELAALVIRVRIFFFCFICATTITTAAAAIPQRALPVRAKSPQPNRETHSDPIFQPTAAAIHNADHRRWSLKSSRPPPTYPLSASPAVPSTPPHNVG